MSNFIEIEETFLWTDGRTVRKYAQTDGHLRPALLGRLCRKVDLKINKLRTFPTKFAPSVHHRSAQLEQNPLQMFN